MSLFVALLRGINVGGHNKLPMPRLRERLSDLGCRDVATYIQSGNVICGYAGTSTDLARLIAGEIEREFGFRSPILVIDASEFMAMAEANPFHGLFKEAKNMHVLFLQEPANDVNQERLAALVSDSERFELIDRAFYLHAPGGIGRSRLAAGAEKCLGVNATARNWRTVEKLCEMLAERL